MAPSPRPVYLHKLRDYLMDIQGNAGLVLDRRWLAPAVLPLACRAEAAEVQAWLELGQPALVAFQEALGPELARLDVAARRGQAA